MTEFLMLTLYAPLASWGDIAVGEFRGSWDRPSRSAVLGLVAAALGVTRDDQPAHDDLDTGYGVAVRADAFGAPLVDYHTTQTVDAMTVKRRQPATRSELLAVRDRQTILSRRTYRQDALATVALWVRDADRARWPLATLQAALRRPGFALYAGRKANALGLPTGPEVVPHATLADAFAAYGATRGMSPDANESDRMALMAMYDGLRSRDTGDEVAHDPCVGFASGLRPLRRDVRRDAGAHRGRWQFADRVVEVGVLPGASIAGGSARGDA